MSQKPKLWTPQQFKTTRHAENHLIRSQRCLGPRLFPTSDNKPLHSVCHNRGTLFFRITEVGGQCVGALCSTFGAQQGHYQDDNAVLITETGVHTQSRAREPCVWVGEEGRSIAWGGSFYSALYLGDPSNNWKGACSNEHRTFPTYGHRNPEMKIASVEVFQVVPLHNPRFTAGIAVNRVVQALPQNSQVTIGLVGRPSSGKSTFLNAIASIFLGYFVTVQNTSGTREHQITRCSQDWHLVNRDDVRLTVRDTVGLNAETCQPTLEVLKGEVRSGEWYERGRAVVPPGTPPSQYPAVDCVIVLLSASDLLINENSNELIHVESLTQTLRYEYSAPGQPTHYDVPPIIYVVTRVDAEKTTTTEGEGLIVANPQHPEVEELMWRVTRQFGAASTNIFLMANLDKDVDYSNPRDPRVIALSQIVYKAVMDAVTFQRKPH